MRKVYVFRGNEFGGELFGKVLEVTFNPSEGMDGFLKALEEAPSVTGEERHIPEKEWRQYKPLLWLEVKETGSRWSECPVCGGEPVYGDDMFWRCEDCGTILGAEY